MSISIKKAALNFFLLLALSLTLSEPLNGAEITFEPQVGFHGLFQLGRPFPLKVDLTNFGRPVEGTLEVKVSKGGPTRGVDAYSFHHRREVFLSAHSRKSVQFTVDPDSISRPLTVNFSSPRVTLSKEIDLRRYFSPSPLILLLTENSVSPPIPLASASPSPLISLSAQSLPYDARAYQGVSTIIFYEQSLRDLSRPQTMALERWLSSGGRMLILGSMHYALYQEPSMGRFLPVRVAGLKKITSLPSLERIYGEEASSLRDLLAQDSRLLEGNILIEEEGTPILVEMSRGRGRVFYLSLDVGRPPLSRWEGLSLLFRDLLGPAPEKGSPVEASWNDPVFLQLLLKPSFISTYMPAGSFILWLVIYLGGLGLLAWLWLQQRLPRRTLVLSFFSLVALSSFGGYLHFNRGGNIPDGVLFSSTLLESLSGGYVEAQSNVALFSTRRQHYDLRVERGWTDLEPVLPRVGTADDGAVVVQEEGSHTRFRFPLREWDYRLFKIRSMDRFPFRTEVQKQGDRISLRLANLTTKDLEECWLVVSGERFFLGNIVQGSSQSREFRLSSGRPSSRGDQPDKADIQEIVFDDETREILFRHSFFPQDRGMSRWGDSTVVFFGWVRGEDRRAWVDDTRILTQEYTLFRVTIPLEVEEEL